AGSDGDKALAEAQVDAVWIIGVPEATAVQSFLRNPNVRPMSFPMSEAFTRIFPDLARMTLPQGTVDIERIIPANDVQLIGTKSKVLIRSDLHPEIVQLCCKPRKRCMADRIFFIAAGNTPVAPIQNTRWRLLRSISTRTVLRSCSGICRCGSPSTSKEQSPWW